MRVVPSFARPTLSITVDARSENDSGFFAVLAELIGQQTHSGSLVFRMVHCSLFNNRKK